MALAKQQPAADPTIVWYPISTVPNEHAQAWVRWHDNSQGVTALAGGRDAMWWSSRGATHWRTITEAEAVAYKGVRR